MTFWSCDAIGIINGTTAFLVKIIKMRCRITFWVLQCHLCWCHCHMMPIVSSKAPFHLLGQDDQKEMQ